jgi:hypothetical protein
MRDTVAEKPNLTWEDHMYGNLPAPGADLQEGDNYNFSPDLENERTEDPGQNYGNAPRVNGPGLAERGDYGDVPNRPEPSRPGRLARLFSRSEASRREAFINRPLPTPDASPEKRQAYLNAAGKAGYDITASDLESFLHDVSQSGKAYVISQAISVPLPGGEGVLGEILVKQNPELAEQQRFVNRSLFDAKSPARPGEFADLEFDAVFADEARFNAAMGRIEKLKPLSPKASFQQFDAVQRAFRGVGVRLTVEDFQQYAADVKQNGAAALQRPGGDEGMSLGEKMLVDLQRSPANRALIGASAERWGHVLSKNPQMPTRQESWSKVPAQSWVGDALQPQPPARQPESGYVKIPAEFRVENPYGQRIPAPPESYAQRPENPYGNSMTGAPAKVTRDGVERQMPPGYRQDGKIVAIHDDAVFQATRAVRSQAGAGIETARYDLAEITQAIGREQLEAAMEQGHTVSVRARAGQLEVVDLDAREQSRERSHEQALEVNR